MGVQVGIGRFSVDGGGSVRIIVLLYQGHMIQQNGGVQSILHH